MAYNNLQLATISKMGAVFEKTPLRFSFWTYKSDVDNLATIFTADYFNEALYGNNTDGKTNGVLAVGDVILVQETDASNIAFGIVTDVAGVATLVRKDFA